MKLQYAVKCTLILGGILTLSTQLHAADSVVQGGVVRIVNSNGTNGLYVEGTTTTKDETSFNFYESLYQYGYQFTIADGKLYDSNNAEVGATSDAGYSFSMNLVFNEENGVVKCVDAYNVANMVNSSTYYNHYSCDNGFDEVVSGTLHGYDGDLPANGLKSVKLATKNLRHRQ